MTLLLPLQRERERERWHYPSLLNEGWPNPPFREREREREKERESESQPPPWERHSQKELRSPFSPGGGGCHPPIHRGVALILSKEGGCPRPFHPPQQGVVALLLSKVAGCPPPLQRRGWSVVLFHPFIEREREREREREVALLLPLHRDREVAPPLPLEREMAQSPLYRDRERKRERERERGHHPLLGNAIPRRSCRDSYLPGGWLPS